MTKTKTVRGKTGKTARIPKKFIDKVPRFDRLLLEYKDALENGKITVFNGRRGNARARIAARRIVTSLMEDRCYEDAVKVAKKHGSELKDEMREAAKIFLSEKLNSAIAKQDPNPSLKTIDKEDVNDLVEQGLTYKEIRRITAQWMREAETYKKETLEKIEGIKRECEEYGLNFEEVASEALQKAVRYAINGFFIFDFREAGRVLGLNRIQLFRIAKELYSEVDEGESYYRYRTAEMVGLIKQRQEATIVWVAEHLAEQGIGLTTEWMSKNEFKLTEKEMREAKIKGLELHLRNEVTGMDCAVEFAGEVGVSEATLRDMLVDIFFELLKTDPERATEMISRTWNYQTPEEVNKRAGNISKAEREDMLLIWISQRKYFKSDVVHITDVLGWGKEKAILEAIATQIEQGKRELFGG